MKLVEAIAMKLNRSVQVLVGELARIDATDGVSDEYKRQYIEVLFKLGMNRIRDGTMREAKHLLADNLHSHHDFDVQMQEIIKPPVRSVANQVNGQVVNERHP